MTHIHSWRRFINDVARAAKDEQLLDAFLRDLLTPAEIHDLPLRLDIIRQLKSETPQRQIAESLGVSIAKVTRGSRMLLNKSGGFNKFYKTS